MSKMITTKSLEMAYVSPLGSGTETSVSKSPKDCPYYDNCSANLCPLDSIVSKRIWLPEENDTYEICRNPEFASLQFVKTQKKIRKALRKRTAECNDYFTYDMLNRDITVKSGIRGVLSDPPDNVRNPMAWYERREKLWLANHPERKKLSMEEIQRRIAHMKTMREGIKK
jgi:hypothetical protein